MSELSDAQSQLQIEADEVVRVLDLDALLGKIGRPIRVGSSAMGLMVRRDIDITVVCSELNEDTLAVFSAIAAQMISRTDCVMAVRFRNDTGDWNMEPEKYPDGHYLGLSVRMPDQHTWAVDIWVVDEPEKQPDIQHLTTLLPRLSEADREAILAIKLVLAAPSPGAAQIPSALVYGAVMDQGIRTYQEFEHWCRRDYVCASSSS
ncbi:hypothetical protein [Ketogulonicigenium robustum]|uniref:hypothetical protein n=1 Tax=Ketogulonicigenium robustum TaxID=92947 RepID=UPI000A26C96A|nr:hypothetical protein [Ketogulonicigenium robustum]